MQHSHAFNCLLTFVRWKISFVSHHLATSGGKKSEGDMVVPFFQNHASKHLTPRPCRVGLGGDVEGSRKGLSRSQVRAAAVAYPARARAC
jgi:hypothetical protein